MKAQGEWRYSSTFSLSLTLDWGARSTPCPGRFTPGNDTRYPLYGRRSGPQGRSRWVQKISPTPGFDPRTVQPVVSSYTNWATPPRETPWYLENKESHGKVRVLSRSTPFADIFNPPLRFLATLIKRPQPIYRLLVTSRFAFNFQVNE
jgi:hypothetical protein